MTNILSAGVIEVGSRRRDLMVASLAHVLHDGYTDLLYVLLPVWQKEYALSYASLAVMRALYYGTMAAAQVPVTHWLGGLGAPALLAAGTALAATGFVIAGLTTGLAGLVIGLIVGGLGSSTQHPNASALVSQAYGANARGPLGLYNFAGDIGKAIFPAATAALLVVVSWHTASLLIAAVGFAVAAAIAMALPRAARRAMSTKAEKVGGKRRGFPLLLAIGTLDTSCRMGFLLFLPFLLKARGADGPALGIAFALVFIGGAFGKAACGWLGSRLGVLGTVAATEAATALLILATLVLPLPATFVVLPVLGVMLNGTSSVLYGTVPEFAATGDTARLFATFYTGVIGAGALAPIAYGIFADHAGRPLATAAAAMTALATLPLAVLLARAMSSQRIDDAGAT